MTDRTDNFNRANGALGSNWTDLSDANHAGALTIVSNAVKPNSANDSAAIWSADTFANDQYSQAAYTHGTAGEVAGCIVRGQSSPSVKYYDFLSSFGGFNSVIEYYDGTNWNQLAAGTSGAGTVRCEVTGTTITGKVNGSTIITTTDATLSSGLPGLHIFSTNSDAILDDWLGGPISGGGDTLSPQMVFFI